MDSEQTAKAQKLCETVRSIMNSRDEAAIKELEEVVGRLANQSQKTFATEVREKAKQVTLVKV